MELEKNRVRLRALVLAVSNSGILIGEKHNYVQTVDKIKRLDVKLWFTLLSNKVFENRVLRRIFEPKRDEVTGEWKKLHYEDLMIYTPHPLLFG